MRHDITMFIIKSIRGVEWQHFSKVHRKRRGGHSKTWGWKDATWGGTWQTGHESFAWNCLPCPRFWSEGWSAGRTFQLVGSSQWIEALSPPSWQPPSPIGLSSSSLLRLQTVERFSKVHNSSFRKCRFGLLLSNLAATFITNWMQFRCLNQYCSLF